LCGRKKSHDLCVQNQLVGFYSIRAGLQSAGSLKGEHEGKECLLTL
jgi:hypothetical protein